MMAESQPSTARDRAILAAQIADEEKATDVLVLEVAPISSIADYFVLANGSNRRLVRRLAEAIEVKIGEKFGERPVRVEGAREQEWVLIDYGDMVVHVFLDEIREFYEIERLYNDVPTVAWA